MSPAELKVARRALGLSAAALARELAAALQEMLDSHSMENIGVNASMRRINAKKQARIVLAKAKDIAP